MNEILTEVCLKYNIDPHEDYNYEILKMAYIDQVNINENFLKSIGICVDSLKERIGKKYHETKKRMARLKGSGTD